LKRRKSLFRPLVAVLVSAMLLPAVTAAAEGDESSGIPAGDGRREGTKVLVASAVYPGLGQLMNGSEYKAAIITAIEAALVTGLVVEDRRTRNSLRLYEQTREARYYEDYARHFDRRQTLIWWVVIAALYGLTDAYVDAHLSGFEDDARPRMEGSVGENADGDAEVRIGLALRF
jgi:hypothetical protein